MTEDCVFLDENSELVNIVASYPEDENSEIVNIVASYPEDDELFSLLKSWSLDHMYLNFLEEKISIEVLKILNPKHIEDLMKNWKIGERALFQHHFEEWRKALNCPFEPVTSITQPSESCTAQAYSKCLSPCAEPSLNNIISNDCRGLTVLKFYENNNSLNNEHRNLLINIVTRYFIHSEQTLTLNLSHKLEKEILQMFPSEKLEYYRSEKRGKIYTRYCNSKHTSKSLAQNNQQNECTDRKRNISDDDAEKSIVKRIRYDNLAAEELNELWEATCNLRRKSIMHDCKTVAEILKVWPEYAKPSGYRLMDIDFKFFNSNAADLLEVWRDKMVKLFNYFKNRKEVLKTIALQNIPPSSVEKGEISYIFATLSFLHAYLYPTGKSTQIDNSGKKSVKRYSVKDSEESVCFVAQSNQQIEQHIRFLKQKNQSLQPFILAIGDQQHKAFEKFFLFLDDHKLVFENFIRCFDICYKCYHIFDLKYPDASFHFWKFIEMYFFNMYGKTSKSSSKASILLSELNNMEM